LNFLLFEYARLLCGGGLGRFSRLQYIFVIRHELLETKQYGTGPPQAFEMLLGRERIRCFVRAANCASGHFLAIISYKIFLPNFLYDCNGTFHALALHACFSLVP
jgi:hypothetical protein